MNYSEAIQKAVKLLRLSQSNNPHEAALAASRAQEIIDRYQIEATALNLDGSQEPEEPIKDFGLDPLDAGAGRISTWTWRLFSNIARLHGCRGYKSARGGIAIVGRPSDVQTVRYFYAWLKAEVNQLAERHCKGYGRSWANNFRNGVIDTIADKLAASRKETHATVIREIVDASGEQTTTALVRVQQAIAKIEKRGEETAAWMKANLKLVNSSGGRSTYNPSARAAGRAAGHSIRMQPAKGHLN